LGAYKVIDYSQEDFAHNGKTYDLIFDVLGRSSFSRVEGSLTANGIYLLASFKMDKVFQMLRTSIFGSKKVICAMASEKQEDMVLLKELVEQGKIKTIIDRTFPLEQADAAHRYFERGQKKGHVIISVGHDQT
jgi:NADPH:quinone reductase-like Zn-dependent oxidoreductase